MLYKKLSINPLRDAYRPTVAFLKTMPTVPVTASAVFGFEVGLRPGGNDDARLGMFSGDKPKVVVVDWRNCAGWNQPLWHTDLKAYYYTRKAIERDYHPIFRPGDYTVYQLNSWALPSSASTAVARGPALTGRSSR